MFAGREAAISRSVRSLATTYGGSSLFVFRRSPVMGSRQGGPLSMRQYGPSHERDGGLADLTESALESAAVAVRAKACDLHVVRRWHFRSQVDACVSGSNRTLDKGLTRVLCWLGVMGHALVSGVAERNC
jgi:hypothetical protein